MLAAERAENERLRQIIKELQRHRFGRRAESLPVDQLLLGLEEAEQIEAEGFAAEDTADTAKREARARKRRANRGSLPAHLPRIEQIIDIPDKICPCCKGMLHVMGEDRSERLDIVPAQFRVIVTRRPKYACRSCEEVVVQAPAPPRLVEGGIPTEATVAHVLVSKYADHLPLYRQAQIYARQGVNLDRSTLADWVGKAAFLLRPIHERLFERLKASGKLFADETTAPVLDPGRGRTKTGQLFAYARDDRPWGGIAPPGVAYLYAPDRKAEQPLRHLQGFVGILQVDGYAGYRALAERNAVSLAFCWAHVRRRFYELAQSGPAPIATEALQRIAELYKIENEIKPLAARPHPFDPFMNQARNLLRPEGSDPLSSHFARADSQHDNLARTELAHPHQFVHQHFRLIGDRTRLRSHTCHPPRACLPTPRAADFAEFSSHARNFCEGLPGVRQAKVTKQAVKDAPERVCRHALAAQLFR